MSATDDGPDDEQTRALLRAAGKVDVSPPGSIARDAIARLRGRRRGAANMNELFRIVDHFIRGLTTILGSGTVDDGSEQRRG